MWHPQNQRNAEGIVCLVDDREGGGDRHYLQRIAATFTSEKLRFETQRLPSKMHDYLFVYRTKATRTEGVHSSTLPDTPVEDIVLPILIERKAETDLAASMKDGRWTRQHDSMKRTAVELFGSCGCRCLYILEGNVYHSKKCPCACGSVGGCTRDGWPAEEYVRSQVIERQRSCIIGK